MKKIIMIAAAILMVATIANAGTRVSVCIPWFGVSGTVDGTYTAYTDYVVHDVPIYCPPPPPPRYHYHRPPPPPPPRHFHRPPPPPPPPSHHGGHHPPPHFKR